MESKVGVNILGNLWKSVGISLLGLTLISGCNQSAGGGKRKAGGGVNNSPSTVNQGYGRYLKDNPIALTGSYNIDSSTNYNLYLDSSQDFITNEQFLIGPCAANSGLISECFEVKKDDLTTDYLTSSDGRWAFGTRTESFRQVQLYGNMRDIIDDFHNKMEWSYSFGLSYSAFYNTSHPSDLFDSTKRPFWFAQNLLDGTSGKLIGYSECNQENNAFFEPSSNEVCMGYVQDENDLWFVYDPTITFHEMGHAFNQIMLNTRNLASGTSFDYDTNLGYMYYDEAGSIGEGICDYFSYIMNERSHFAEWALGKFLEASRPLSEDDPLHSSGIETTFQGRLSYPTYLNYDPNEPDANIEDVHYAGQIISHFLVALTEKMESYCTWQKADAIRFVTHVMMETFAELGDQTAQGFDSAAESTVNLNSTSSLEWISTVNPINFRKFVQTMAKYIRKSAGNPLLNLCTNNGIATHFDQDELETLLDSYGLLLFKTYNTNGNGILTGHAAGNISVPDANRVKTVLISKDLIKIDPRQNSTKAYIIDSRNDIANAIQGLQQQGQISEVSSQIDSNFGFNNGNSQISPGEIIGLSINIYNDSNSEMAGVQILANDWDHAKNGKMCNNLGDEFPLNSEGAADLTSGEGTQGGCDYTTRYNGENSVLEPDEELAPICFVQLSDDSSTSWYQQDELMRRISLDNNNCLGGSDSEKDCFIRAIKGADNAYYSRIAPKTTWADTLADSSGIPLFNYNNVIFMEVSPWIPPGTTFNCRFRARFTNCDDCWHDSTSSYDDYLDYEFSGGEPFKIINFQFTVID